MDDFVVGHLAELLDLGKQRGWVSSTMTPAVSRAGGSET